MAASTDFDLESATGSDARSAQHVHLEEKEKSLSDAVDRTAVGARIKKGDDAKELKKAVLHTLDIDPASVRRDRCSSRWGGLVNMTFLVVLVGCEIDLYGFCLVFKDYWNMGIDVMKVLLVIMPCGYLIAVGMYMCYKDHVNQQHESETITGANGERGRGYASRRRKPMDLQFYHFMPILRYYLILKDKECADIEGVFRVNSLSSFTLGLAQLAGIGCMIFVKKEEITIYVKINMASQVLNWFITFMYYLTPVSDKMAGHIQVETLNANTDEDLRNKFHEYLDRKEKYAKDLSKKRDLDAFERNVHTEIWTYANTNETTLAIDQLDIKENLDILRLIRRRENLGFARIGGF